MKPTACGICKRPIIPQCPHPRPCRLRSFGGIAFHKSCWLNPPSRSAKKKRKK